MRTYKLFQLIVVFATFDSTVVAGPIADAADKLLATTPKAAFDIALKNHDLRLITILFCGGITPGFNFRDYSGSKPTENNLGVDCYSLLGSKDMVALQKLEPWVTKYNALIYKRLNNAK